MIDVLRDQAPGFKEDSSTGPNTTEPGMVATDGTGRSLMVEVISRIESRVPGRIRGLCVSREGDTFALAGSCHSYYAKQVAQHTAMEVLAYRKLINLIQVLPPK